jgi:acyl-coenzyme A synthetase/AMP-(fatty) acid ligase
MKNGRFAQTWRTLCRQHWPRVALAWGDKTWRYAELAEQVALLQKDMSGLAGRLFLFAPANDPESLVLILAGLAAGAVPVLADPVWNAEDRARIVQRDGIDLEITYPSRTLTDKVVRGELRLGDFNCVSHPAVTRTHRLRADTVLCRFTSGSTGLPRGLQFRLDALLAAAEGWKRGVGLTEQDRVLCLASLHNGLAFNTSLLSVFSAGAQLIFLPGKVLASGIERALHRHDPTVLVAFPFVYDMAMRAQRSLAGTALRCAVSSAAALEPRVNEYWRAHGLSICNYYGLVELGPVTCNAAGDPLSLGPSLPHARVSITDEQGEPVAFGEPGIVRIHSPSMASDYLDGESPGFADNLDRAGYYVSKDRGRFDARGHLILLGRVDSLLNLHGRKIEPKEIEQSIRELGEVSDVVVKGEEQGGKLSIVAYVESARLDRKAVMQHCIARLAPYKVPHFVHVLNQFPRSSTGKVAVGQMRLQIEG